jgi:hypothetical protein
LDLFRASDTGLVPVWKPRNDSVLVQHILKNIFRIPSARTMGSAFFDYRMADRACDLA